MDVARAVGKDAAQLDADDALGAFEFGAEGIGEVDRGAALDAQAPAAREVDEEEADVRVEIGRAHV